MGRVAATRAEAEIAVHVDDISGSISARGLAAFVRALTLVDDLVVEETQQKLRLPFSSEESTMIATTR